jgi:hypothetical protein
VELRHFGLMVDFFLLALAKKLRSVLGQILLPAGDLGRVNPVLSSQFSQSLGLRQCGQGVDQRGIMTPLR